jgi:hypothetical protein
MDTINHQVSNNPGDDNMKDLPFAQEVATDILNNVKTDYDFSAWQTLSDAEQAQAFRELIGEMASYKYDPQFSSAANQSIRLLNIDAFLETVIKGWAVREGYAP